MTSETQNKVDLIGSDKQISWAEKIRTKTIAVAVAQISQTARPADVEMISKIKAALEQEVSASWWIENGQGEPMMILKRKGQAMRTAGVL